MARYEYSNVTFNEFVEIGNRINATAGFWRGDDAIYSYTLVNYTGTNNSGTMSIDISPYSDERKKKVLTLITEILTK